MSLIWVTGSSGSGKSTVNNELKARGYLSYDVDNDGLARWTNLKSGFVHPKSSVKPEQRTPEFIKAHGWFVPRSIIEDIRNKATDKPAFLCGVLDNYEDLNDLIDGIIALWISEEDIKSRLAIRGPREWGHQPHEINQTLQRHQTVYEKYRSMGAIVIDASMPINQVVEQILLTTGSQFVK